MGIGKLTREKKGAQESKQKTEEDIQSMEDRCNHLARLKSKLEQSLDEAEDGLEREKKAKKRRLLPSLPRLRMRLPLEASTTSKSRSFKPVLKNLMKSWLLSVPTVPRLRRAGPSSRRIL